MSAPTRRSLAIFLALMAYLVVVKVVLDLIAVQEVLPGQATAFSWPAIGVLTLLGACSVWLAPRAGLPELWDPNRSPRKWLLFPVIVGLGVGGLNLAHAALSGSPKIMAEAANAPAINVPFPESILFYSGGAIVVETLYRLILITLPLWLIATVILRDRGRVAVFWVLAVLTSLIEPFDFVTLLAGHPDLIAVMVVGGFGINLFEAWLFWRHGFLAPLTFRLAYYLVWHIVGSTIGY